jgi:Transposase
MSDETFAWFVGADWGSEKHQVCILDQQGTIGGERNFPHSGAGLAELGDWLLSSRLALLWQNWSQGYAELNHLRQCGQRRSRARAM